MVDPAKTLSELHALHQRARALRDRLTSGPKTLATREKVLASRRGELEKAQKALKDARAQAKNREGQLQSIEARIDDHKTKLNQAKKQIDYDAIRNQIAHEQATKSKIEDEILHSFEALEEQAAELAKFEADVKAVEKEVADLRASLDTNAGPMQAQLNELEQALAASEEIIPEEQKDQYRRVIKQRTSDAMAAVDGSACTGCYVEVTAQMMNDLINGDKLLFCRSCGRVLYLADKGESRTRRTGA